MTVKPVTEAAYRRNEICSSGLVLIRDMGSPNHQSGGTPGVGSRLGRFWPFGHDEDFMATARILSGSGYGNRAHLGMKTPENSG